jgi:PBP1b-binding outer membrane lipoprotein LpoB
MKYFLNLILLVLILVSCKNQSSKSIDSSDAESNAEIVLAQNDTLVKVQKTDTITSLWNRMIDKGGCLGGQQRYSPKQRHMETLVFSETEWNDFSNNDISKLTTFLISKLSDTTKTTLHTCSFFATRTGEMAVYSLQHIHKKNWCNFDEFAEYSERKTTNAMDQPQIWLWNILADSIQRKKLATLYLNELK